MDPDFIIKLMDGGVTAINDSMEYVAGCPTCDYGSQYITDYWFILTKYLIHIEVKKEYEFGVPASFLIRLIYDNVDRVRKMSEKEFTTFIASEFQTLNSIDPYTYNSGRQVTIDIKEKKHEEK